MWRFGVVFGMFGAIGLAIDLGGLFGDTGVSATMAFGSLGIVVGVLAVLVAKMRPLDDVLVLANEALGRGEVVVTVTVAAGGVSSDITETVTRLGGEMLYVA